MNDIRFRFEISEHEVGLRPIVDGRDLLSDYRNSEGLDPDNLLPPLSSRLFPTRDGRRVLIGACSCGITECGALAVWIRRHDDQVVWEPDELPKDETISRDYRFSLVSYLDAVDRAGGDRPGEGLGRRVARKVRRMNGRFDQSFFLLRGFDVARVDWISAWPWESETVCVSFSSMSGQEIVEYAVEAQETEDESALRIVADINERTLPRRRALG